eukprot:7523560-Alexandrium_andersonii.AAC.1
MCHCWHADYLKGKGSKQSMHAGCSHTGEHAGHEHPQLQADHLLVEEPRLRRDDAVGDFLPAEGQPEAVPQLLAEH